MIETTTLEGVKVIVPKKTRDSRGFFSETYNRESFLQGGIAVDFVQDNQSRSAAAGTIRGLHFQSPPFAQDKLIRVLKGGILDVAVDLRRSSPTYGQHFAIELSAENFKQMFVPIGFAHGFCTIERDTEVLYKVSNYYAPEHDHGLAWDDPALGIAWPVTAEAATLSDKDRRQPRLADLDSPFW
ncbi:MAG: dTDP-4-dehydrorhamnose 3,5-epimerase [Methylovirgula sp.]